MLNINNEEEFTKSVRRFVETEIKPRAAEIDRDERFPVETVQKLGELGLFAIPFPKEYGGLGGTYKTYLTVVNEISKVCAATGLTYSCHVSLCAQPIYDYGTEEQKRKYLPRLLSGEYLGAFALTEPNAGTDAGQEESVAVLQGDRYVLNGAKFFITNAGYADVYIVFALTNKELGTKGMSAFIVESSFPGFSAGKQLSKMGMRGSATRPLIFKNVEIPKENLLGKEGDGFKIAMKTLDGGRVGIAAQALGIAQGALNETIAYAKKRKQFRRPISAFQNTQFQLADLFAEIEGARLLTVQAAAALDNKSKDLSLKAAVAKLYAAKVAVETTNKCLQLFGGYGYLKNEPIERMYRDAKITEIYEGTSEVQKMVISGALLR